MSDSVTPPEVAVETGAAPVAPDLDYLEKVLAKQKGVTPQQAQVFLHGQPPEFLSKLEQHAREGEIDLLHQLLDD